MIKRMFMTFLAVAFPWIILLMDDNPGGGVVALIMQATIIGWIPASLWALRIVNEKAMAERVAHAEKVVRDAQKKANKKETGQ
ncbi:hypothetical protein [Legionella feeleii]|uniref:YqaE/Pmp3 family membrane protein n=1 Tax=Legionella feeleii TaxID=453 RepID=A0A0W0U8M7_9GAMM|nr:hypothetical protein [Legionella feeleii]KTD04154.1 hypothetical protein Lfee_0242 [Legionella feeleii]SPX60734.1 Uncharacterised protein [Legionella feeleii]